MIGAVFSYRFVEVFALLVQDPSKLCTFYMCSPNSPYVWTLKPRVYAFAPVCLRACLTSHIQQRTIFVLGAHQFPGCYRKNCAGPPQLNYSALDSEQKKVFCHAL